MATKTFVVLLSFTTISALLGPTFTNAFGITWQSYCMIQGSFLSLIAAYLEPVK